MKKIVLVLTTFIIALALTGCKDEPVIEKQDELPTTEEYRTISCYKNGGTTEYEYYFDRIERIKMGNDIIWRNGVQSTSLIESQEEAFKDANPGMDFFEIFDKRLEDSIGNYEEACEMDVEVVDVREE